MADDRRSAVAGTSVADTSIAGTSVAGTSVARQLTRGGIGFGLIGAALALTPSVGPATLLLAPAGMVALRGCPMCWIADLIQMISAGRLKCRSATRTCVRCGDGRVGD
jgi:hypothetical protein